MDESEVITFRTPERNRDTSNDNESNEEHEIDQNESITHKISRQMKEMSRNLVKEVGSVTSDIRDALRDVTVEIASMQQQIDEIQRRETTPISSSSPLNLNRNEPRVRFRSPHPMGIGDGFAHFRHQNTKMKAQTYSGEEDLEDYLAQFDIVAELNDWDYQTKSLYLASNLTGGARALLNELDCRKRRDYDCLIEALKTRFGSENQAEVFKSKLQTRVKGKDEKIPELAQNIKKLTRKAYPCATSDVIDVLAIDYFIDALNDSDIRLRLREISPKTLSEAEKIAARLEAHRIADRDRGKNQVMSVNQPENKEKPTEMSDLDKMKQDFAQLSKDMQDLKSSQFKRQNPRNGYQGNQNGWRNNGARPQNFSYSGRNQNFSHNNGRNQNLDNRNVRNYQNHQQQGSSNYQNQGNNTQSFSRGGARQGH